MLSEVRAGRALGLLVLMGCIPLGFLYWGMSMADDGWQLLWSGKIVTAEVYHRSIDHDQRYLIDCHFQAAGNDYDKAFEVSGSEYLTIRIGSHFEITYLPSNPDISSRTGDYSNLIGGSIMAVVAFVVFMFFLVLLSRVLGKF